MPPKPSLTHFLCIPLCTPAGRRQLSPSLSAFRADVTSPDSFGVPEQAVRPLGTLHLTLGVMSFPRNEGLEDAVAFLKTIAPRQILAEVAVPSGQTPVDSAAAGAGASSAPFSVSLRGLHSMQSSLSRSSTLYAAPVDATGVLARFCERLRSDFREAGLMVEESKPLLLHATILNTIYVKGRSAGWKRGEKLTLDARPILDRYRDYVWMEDVPVETIAICKMGAKKLDDGDEAYEVVAEIKV